MKVYDIQSEQRDGTALVSAKVEPAGGGPREIWFRLEGIAKTPTSMAEALAVALLAPCMYDAEHLKLYGALSWTLARNLEAAQDVLTAWHPHLTPIDVLASQFTRVWRGIRRGTGTGCCFTAGVNSWYSLLKHDQRITHLLLVRGFDPALDDDGTWQAKHASIDAIARRMDKRLITCETNLRQIADKRTGHATVSAGDFWAEYLHGSALAAVGLLLQREIGELIVPAVHTYQRLKPSGSSPLLDPLWSSDRLSVSHDGCEASRAEKVAFLATSQAALETLHVCDRGPVNCGRCDKCVRTQLALRSTGALDRVTAFAGDPPPTASDAIIECLEPPRPTHEAIAIPHAVAVARYIARVLTQATSSANPPAGEIRIWRRAED